MAHASDGRNGHSTNGYFVRLFDYAARHNGRISVDQARRLTESFEGDAWHDLFEMSRKGILLYAGRKVFGIPDEFANSYRE